MYFMLLALVIHSSEVVPVPQLHSQYKNLDECRMELERIALDPRQKKVVSKIFGYTIVSKTEKVSTLAFCVKDMRSI